MTRPSVYEAAGGAPAFLALATAFHARCLADPVLEHPFSHGIDPRHVQRLADYWGEVLGGPASWTGGAGSQVGMIALHAHMGAGDELGARFTECFVRAADDVGLPGDAELRQTLRAYMEWAVADVLGYDPPDAVVPDTLPMPHWSWDGLQAG